MIPTSKNKIFLFLIPPLKPGTQYTRISANLPKEIDYKDIADTYLKVLRTSFDKFWAVLYSDQLPVQSLWSLGFGAGKPLPLRGHSLNVDNCSRRKSLVLPRLLQLLFWYKCQTLKWWSTSRRESNTRNLWKATTSRSRAMWTTDTQQEMTSWKAGKAFKSTFKTVSHSNLYHFSTC